jgi:hypothetical protein
MGRSVKWTEEKLKEIAILWNDKASVKWLASTYETSVPHMYQLLKKAGVGPSTLKSMEQIEGPTNAY